MSINNLNHSSENLTQIVKKLREITDERQASISYFQAVLNDIPEDGNKRVCEQLLEEAIKKPTSISLVKSFLLCAPENREPNDFATIIQKGIDEGKLKLSDDFKQAQSLSTLIRDEWLASYEDKLPPDNIEDLPASHKKEFIDLASAPTKVRDLFFIEMLIKKPAFSELRIMLP